MFATKLSDEEAAVVDAARGSLTRAMWLRLMIVDYKRTLPKAPQV